LQCLLPGFGAEGEDVACWVRADANQDVAQVVEGIDAVQLAGGEQRVDDARTFSPALGSGEEPILSTDRQSRFILPVSRIAPASTTRGIRRSGATSTSCTKNLAAARRCTSACGRTARAW
jgi:hypothetical protein